MALSNLERQLNWQRRHRGTHLRRMRESMYRLRFGSYVMADYCQSTSCKSGGRKLLAHHTNWRSCVDCAPRKDGRGYCHKLGHLITVCWGCHTSIHRQAEARERARQAREFGMWKAHMEEISSESR